MEERAEEREKGVRRDDSEKDENHVPATRGISPHLPAINIATLLPLDSRRKRHNRFRVHQAIDMHPFQLLAGLKFLRNTAAEIGEVVGPQ